MRPLKTFTHLTSFHGLVAARDCGEAPFYLGRDVDYIDDGQTTFASHALYSCSCGVGEDFMMQCNATGQWEMMRSESSHNQQRYSMTTASTMDWLAGNETTTPRPENNTSEGVMRNMTLDCSGKPDFLLHIHSFIGFNNHNP